MKYEPFDPPYGPIASAFRAVAIPAKRFWWVFVVIAGAALLIWLAQNYKIVKVIQKDAIQEETEQSQRPHGSIEREPEAAQIPRSPRHESGDLEKSRILQRERELRQQVDSQINALFKYDGEHLMAYAAGLDVPNNEIRKVYPEYLKTKREIETLETAGFDAENPRLIAKVERLNEIKRQLAEGVINLRSTLKAQKELMANGSNKR